MKPNRKLLKTIRKYILQHSVELVKSEWRYFQKKHPLWGMCYVISEVYYHMEGKNLGFRPMLGKFRNGMTHWWLQHSDGRVIDLVLRNKQRMSGRRAVFMTKKPSKRAQIVIAALQKE